MIDLKEMQRKVQQEMDEMEKSLEMPDGPVEEPVEDTPPGDPPEELPKEDEPPKEDPKPEDEPGDDPPPENPPKEDEPPAEPPPEEDPRDVELRNLRAEVEELKKPKKVETEEIKKTETKTEEPKPIEDIDFLGETDLDDLTRDKSIFNQILNKVYKTGREQGRNDIKEGNELVVRSIPDITKNTIATETQMKSMSDKFYKENEDLKEWGKTVAAVAEELISSNQDKSLNEIFFGDEKAKKESMLATEVRRRLGLKKQALKKDNKDDPPPKLPGTKGGKRQTSRPELSDFEKELDEMDAALNNF